MLPKKPAGVFLIFKVRGRVGGGAADASEAARIVRAGGEIALQGSGERIVLFPAGGCQQEGG